MLLLCVLTCWTGFSWSIKVFIGWSMLLKEKARRCLWLKNNWVDHNVIMQVLFPAAFIVQQIVAVPVHWFLARKSYMFHENEGKLAYLRRKTFVSSSLFGFCTFLLLSDSHHHYQISIVSPTPPPTHYRLCIEPTSTPHLPFFTAQLHLSGVPNLEMALGAKV